MHVYLVSGMHPEIPSTGGVRPYVLGLANWLGRKGVAVSLIGAGPEVQSNHLEFLSVAPEFPLSNYRFIRALWSWLRRHTIEPGSVIHAQRPDDLYPFAARGGGHTLVCTLHGNPWRGVSQRRLLGRIPYLWAERNSLKAAQHVISVSESGLRQYITRYPWLGNKTSVIPVGIDLDLFHPRERGGSEPRSEGGSRMTLLFAGRLEPEKRVDVLLDAVRGMDPPPKVVIAGDGTLEHRLMGLSRDLGVQFLGCRSTLEMPGLYSTADALVLPSSYEGLPTVVLEAMACGTPVLATEVGDLRGILTDSVTGYFFDGTPQGLRAVLDRHAGELAGMRPHCPAVGRKFGWDSVAARILATYMRLEEGVDGE